MMWTDLFQAARLRQLRRQQSMFFLLTGPSTERFEPVLKGASSIKKHSIKF